MFTSLTLPRAVRGCMLVLFLLLSACALKMTQPIENKGQEKAADRDYFIQVRKSPDAFVGSLVEWAGVIVRFRYVIDGTEFVIQETPEKYWGQPNWKKYSNGWFIARYPQLVDPDVFRKGTKVTLSGEVTGVKKQELKDKTYELPVVQVKDLHIWRAYRNWPYYYDVPLWEQRKEPFDEPQMPFNQPDDIPETID